MADASAARSTRAVFEFKSATLPLIAVIHERWLKNGTWSTAPISATSSNGKISVVNLWLQENKRLGPWGWPTEFVTNVHHHYCLNFKNEP